MTWQTTTQNSSDTSKVGEAVGKVLRGGEVIELISDLGGGKTTFVRGVAKGMGSKDTVASPSFTISRIYPAKDLSLHHYDFYRLQDPGVVEYELAESLSDEKAVVAVEWAETVAHVLPKDRLKVQIEYLGQDKRRLTFSAGDKHRFIIESIK